MPDLSPTIIIGLGGTGMKIGHALLGLFGQTRPDLLLRGDEKTAAGRVKFVFIENDRTEYARVDEWLRGREDLKRLCDYVWIEDFNALRVAGEIENYRKGKAQLDDRLHEMNVWLDSEVNYPASALEHGLRATRQLGRMGIYYRIEQLVQRLTHARDVLRTAAGIERVIAGAITIYIITGMTGGVGSSSFLDVSAAVDSVIEDGARVGKIAVLVNAGQYLRAKQGEGFGPSTAEYKMLQINNCAFSNELDYFSKHAGQYEHLLAELSARPSVFGNKLTQVGYQFIPFTTRLIFDYGTSDGRFIPSKNFYTTIANMLFYTLTSATNREFAARVTANALDQDAGYSTLGYRTLRFPRDELSRYFTVRYLYEIFDKILLAKNVDRKKIEEKVNGFADTYFAHEGNRGVVPARLSEQFLRELQTSDGYRGFRTLFSRERLAEEGRSGDALKLAGKDLVASTLHADDIHLQRFATAALECAERLNQPEFLQFHKPYNKGDSVADTLRKVLWKEVQDLVVSQGYFAILGVHEGGTDSPGFLEGLRTRLGKLYQNISARLADLASQQPVDEIKKARDAIIDRAGRGFRKKGIEAIDDLFAQYAAALERYRRKVTEEPLLKLQQRVLYEFAVGDSVTCLSGSAFPLEKGSPTEISRYERELKRVVGLLYTTDPYAPTLLRVFDDGAEGSRSIAAEYRINLPQVFRRSDDDIFTTFLPYPLSSYTDHSGWVRDSLIDRLFEENVAIDASEIEGAVFRSAEDKYPLARIGEDPRSAQANIGSVVRAVTAHFEVKYMAPKTAIGDFLGQNIVQVFEETPKERTGVLVEMFAAGDHGIIYPLYGERAADWQSWGPFVNVKTGPDIGAFVTNTFNVPATHVVVDDSFKDTEIVFVRVGNGIRFDDIAGNDLCKKAYRERDMRAFRPHLHRDWNDCPDGILDPKFDPINRPPDTIEVQLGHSRTEITFLQAFQFCYLLDWLVTRDPAVHNKLFLSDPARVKLEGGLSKPPIFYDGTAAKFICMSGYEILREGGVDKFLIKEALGKDTKRELPISVTPSSKEQIGFAQTVNTLGHDASFVRVFEEFYNLAMKHATGISDSITRHKEGLCKALLEEYLGALDPLLRRERTIDEQDRRMARDFPKELNRLIEKFFHVTLL